jgi:hypothetical protein
VKPNCPNLVLTAVAALALGGCASLDETRDVGHYIVSAPQTPMYRYGPAQSFGPDSNLQQNQHVVMIRRDSGYSRVMTDDGQTGYVSTEDLSPAPAPPKPAAGRGGGDRFVARGGGRPGLSSANRHVQESGPLFDPDLPPLPTQNFEDTGTPHHKSEPKPDDKKSEEKKPAGEKPDFRYPKPRPGFRVNVPDPNAKP